MRMLHAGLPMRRLPRVHGSPHPGAVHGDVRVVPDSARAGRTSGPEGTRCAGIDPGPAFVAALVRSAAVVRRSASRASPATAWALSSMDVGGRLHFRLARPALALG